MLHNKSTLILAGIFGVLYLLFTRLTKDDKKEVMQDVTGKMQRLVDDKFASA
jgi:hypothetical protein